MNKKLYYILFIFFTAFFIPANSCKAQDKKGDSSESLKIINSSELIDQSLLDKNLEIVDLKKYIPSLHFDLRYAESKNFMHEKLYPKLKTTYLRRAAATALKNVVSDLKVKGLGLLIFDAYRPYSVTQLMWQKIGDPRYVADPSKGSGHNRGIAVDLTLTKLGDKTSIPMPTDFDNFSDTAHSGFEDLPDSIKLNRSILKKVMEKNGFIQLSTEWWHFYLPGSDKYDVMDISFKSMKKIASKK
ncbi:MAG: M15 family metallopeptidase [Ginsengibacter sp.]